MEPENLTHAEVQGVLRGALPGVDASDLHGSLSGFLCGGGEAGANDWLDALHIDADGADGVRHPDLQRLYRECRAQFAGIPASVDPLLPSEAAGAGVRGDALVEWCRGFLGGIGLSAALARPSVSSESQGILEDLGVIAASRLQYSGTGEDGKALEDILAFVRVGVAVLHRELARRTGTVH